MCGVSGWYCQGEARPNPLILKQLLIANMERGISATGIAYQDEGGGIRIRKSKGSAVDFIKANEELFGRAAQSPRGLLHTRATTKGSEDKNENNHPVAGYNWAVVHNGTITNDDDVWSYYGDKLKLKRFAEVDTSSLPLVLSRGDTLESSINNLSILSGSFTIAAWNSKDIERILLARFGYNDLLLFLDQENQILYWSSASSAGHVMPGYLIGKHKFMVFSKLADEHVMVLQPGGFNNTRAFKVERRSFFTQRKPAVSNNWTPSGKATTVIEPVRQTFLDKAVGVVGKFFDRTTHAFEKIVVEIPSSDGIRTHNITWVPMEAFPNKPLPIGGHFVTRWWDLDRQLTDFLTSGTPVLETFSGYGRWVFEKEGNKTSLEFKPYKRLKDFWEKAYRTKFKLPATPETAATLDKQFAWEHFDVNMELTNKEIRRFLGFMCPVCGVWMPVPKIQIQKERCSFCRIENRLYPIRRASDGR